MINDHDNRYRRNLMVLLPVLDLEVVGISRFVPLFRDKVQLRLTIKGACMVSRESNLTWPVAKEFLRAVFSVERKLTGISNWEKRHSTLEWILKKYINEERDKTPAKIIILDLNQNRHWLICYEEGRYFILKIFNFLPFQTWRGRYFFKGFVLFGNGG